MPTAMYATFAEYVQAQPNKVRLEARDEQKYKEKLLGKAQVIADSANRLWRKLLLLGIYCFIAKLTWSVELEMQQDIEEE